MFIFAELAMKNAPSKARKVLKILERISSLSRNALIVSWNKAREQPIEVSNKENEPIPPQKNK